MDIFSLILITTGVINLFFGFLIYVKNRRDIVNILYALLVLNLTIWAFSIYFFRIAPDVNLFWSKIAYLSAGTTAFLFLYFTLYFPFKTKLNLYWHIFFSIYYLVLVSLILGTKYVIEEYVIINHNYGLLFGKAYIFYAVFIFLFFGLGFINLIRKYLQSKGTIRIQIEYVLAGALITAFVGTLTNLMLFSGGIFQYNWVGPSSAISLVILFAYAITKHHLFGIRVILTEILVIATGITLLVWAVTAEPFLLKILGGTLFVFFIAFGYQLVRSVIKEIELRAELEKAYTELERIDKAKTEFLSIASHQLRTPLSIIKGYISMILEKTYGEIPEKIKQPLGNVYVSNDRLVKLVNDLLDITRLEMGRIELSLEKANLEEIISSVVEEMKVMAEKKGLYLKYESPKIPLPETSIDKNKIRQVILNLVDNAIKYTQKGGVTVKVRKMNSEVRIEVRDTGVGMSKEEIGNLFEIMARGKAGFQYWTEGAGVGLYTARKFAEMHGGRIWAESPGKDKGSTFYIELPVK